jgi:hypothetical protein
MKMAKELGPPPRSIRKQYTFPAASRYNKASAEQIFDHQKGPLMDWAKYFEKTQGTGVLATADEAGDVNMAIYARPHFMEENLIAFIMRPRRSHQNLRSTIKAAYMFIENGPGYKGHRLYLSKVREEMDHRLIDELRRSKHNSVDSTEESYLVFFRIDSNRPLVGDYPV